MSTVEAIQAELEGVGIVLIPGNPDDAPKSITKEYIRVLNPRVFLKANSGAPVFMYQLDYPSNTWLLVED